MSASILQRLGSSVISLLLCYGAWWVWNEVPRLLRRTEFSDFSFVASLLAVFLILSLLNPVLSWGWGKVTSDQVDENKE